MTNRHLSHYVVGEKIGEGGMGVVYKGMDTRLRRQVALKFVTKSLPLEAAERKRFLREAQAASAINHPNVCVVHAIEEVEGEEFLVMEFIEGLTLRKWIGHRKEELRTNLLPIKDILSMALQVAEGLDAAHRKKIVHRDVKPENVMVTEDGRAKIMDFGLAKLAGESRITRQGSAIGTVAYMSPEQVQGGEIDHTSDIYSFGVLLYEMLSGTVPFHADHAVGMMYAIVATDPKPLKDLRPGIDAGLDRVVMKCMAKDKGGRYPALREVIRDLQAYGEESKTLIAPAVSSFSTGKGTKKADTAAVGSFANRYLYWVAAIAVVLIVGTLYLVNRENVPADALLTISSNPPGSQVFINGTEVGITPLSAYRVPAGRTKVHLQQDSFVPADTTIETTDNQRLSLAISLRAAEEKKAVSPERTLEEKAIPQFSEKEPAPEVSRGRDDLQVASVDALASALINQLREKSPALSGSVAVRPFTFRKTQIGSEFSLYFRSILESRASVLARWSMISSDEGIGESLRPGGSSAVYEIAGTYWELSGLFRVFAVLRNAQTFAVAAQAEGDVGMAEVRRLKIPWLPENIRQVLAEGERLGKPVAEAGDLSLELLTNKGVKNLIFTQGDTLAISVRVNKPCTVRVFYHTADGTKYLLTGENDKKIETAEVNTIVPILSVECTAPFGAEILQAFATSDKFEPLQTKLVDGLYELQDKVETAMIATRGIKRIGGGPGPVERRVVVTTVPK